MKTLLIQGWRGINHSYALVNQYHLLHLATTPGLTIYHQDLEFPRAEWRNTGLGFDDDDAATIASFAPPPPGQHVDVIYRIGYPFRLAGGAAQRVFVFCTSELGRIPPNAIDPASKITEPGAGDGDYEIVTPSRWSQQAILEHGYAKRVHLVPHGVEPELYWPAERREKMAVRKQLDLPADAFIFLNIGAMTWNKGITPLLSAFAIHHQAYPRSRLLLKGADFLYGNMFGLAYQEARKIDPLNVDHARDAIIYSGENLSHEALATLYRASDAYVSPYLAEAFNLPVLEAAASGLPVIVTAGGPTDDFCRPEFSLKIASEFVHSEKGRYLKPDVSSLVELMAQAVENDELRTRAATIGPEWVRDRYSWKSVTRQLAAILMQS